MAMTVSLLATMPLVSRSAPPVPSRRGRPPGDARERVLAVAERIADDEGWDALTMARLAHALGIKPPSLYKHVDSLEALQREIRLIGVQQLSGELEETSRHCSGAEALRELAGVYRGWAKRSPGRYAAQTRLPIAGDSEFERVSQQNAELVRRAAGDLGFRDDASLILWAAVHGFVSLELAGAMTADADVAFDCLLETLIAGMQRVASC